MPVTAVNETQTLDPAGGVTDALEITFTLENLPGAFTVTVPKAGDVVANATTAIQELAAAVGGIYRVGV